MGFLHESLPPPKKIDVLTAKIGEVEALKARNLTLEAKLEALADMVKRLQKDRP